MIDANGVIRDLSAHTGDFAGTALGIDNLARLGALDPAGLPALPEGGRIGCALADVPNFLCVGLNYGRHAAEIGVPQPEEPVLFSKATSCLAGPYDDLRLPVGSTQTDWEIELGMVIGREARNVSVQDALSYVAGFCIVNDVSERDYQMNHGGQWMKGKSAPGFGPVGPWLVTPEDIEDPQNLNLALAVNGMVQQSSNTSDMIFSLAEIIASMSHYMTLRVGDLIATGTPEGVGLGQTPQKFLRRGDILELQIQGLGQQRTAVL
jgi:2-keto-4-pentenoate hydratase/2-oxohepta-3-ene-1,7-dioic acid hydratase in catechol pathway